MPHVNDPYKPPDPEGKTKRYTGKKNPLTDAQYKAEIIRSSGKWKNRSELLLKKYPWCSDPFGIHYVVWEWAEEVHHIKPLVTHPELAFDWDNLAGICTICHHNIEARVRRKIDTEYMFKEYIKNRADIWAVQPEKLKQLLIGGESEIR